MKQVPVYLFTGFLEAGKTRFIQETLEDARFNNGERTLLLMCEDGLEGYDPSTFANENVFIETIEDEEDLQPDLLQEMFEKHKCKRVLVEYNGMWMLTTLFQQMPENWIIAQEFLFCDANSFLSYNANMRQLVYDKLSTCELVVFNRCGPDIDRMALHKVVRASNRRTDIAYEAPDGSVDYDEIEDPLPFDLEAPIVDIEDKDYALFYSDLSNDMQKYDGKTLRYKALVAKSANLPDDTFIVGRQLMTCCVQDIRFAGLICIWPETRLLRKGEWISVTAQVRVQRHKGYTNKKGPVLTATHIESVQPPEETVATFY